MKDIFGKEIVIGDYIIYGAADGRSAVLRVGKVINIVKSKRQYCEDEIEKLKVLAVQEDFGEGPRSIKTHESAIKKVVTLEFGERTCVVPLNVLSNEYFNAINALEDYINK